MMLTTVMNPSILLKKEIPTSSKVALVSEQKVEPLQKLSNFTIFEDEPAPVVSKPLFQSSSKPPTSISSSFPIFEDEPAPSVVSQPLVNVPSKQLSSASSSFPIFEDEPAPPVVSKPSFKSSFPIFEDENAPPSKSSFAIYEDQEAVKVATKPVISSQPLRSFGERIITAPVESEEVYEVEYTEDLSRLHNQSIMSTSVYQSPTMTINTRMVTKETNEMFQSHWTPGKLDDVDTTFSALSPVTLKIDFKTPTKKKEKAEVPKNKDFFIFEESAPENVKRQLLTPEKAVSMNDPKRGKKEQVESISSSLQSLSVSQGRASENPFTDSFAEKMLALVNPPLQTYNRYYDLSNKKSPPSDVEQLGEGDLDLDKCSLVVTKKYGEGVFASVFGVEIVDTWTLDSSDFAIKIQSPPCPWEFYIARQIQERVPQDMKRKFVNAFSQHVYKDKSYLMMDRGDWTLQEVLTKVYKNNGSMEESMVMYYAIEVMSIVQALHNANIIHGDLNPNNLLILNENSKEEWGHWQPGTGSGWGHKGLRLIDFGRSIDLKLVSSDITFSGEGHSKNFRCTEMLSGNNWKHQVDLFGICSTIHCMIHGKFLEVEMDEKTKSWKPKEAFKKGWLPLWEELFHAFLNVKDCNSIPSISHYQRQFENHLASDPLKSKSIKVTLARQNYAMGN
eukprot:TRINITY_DN2649_c0_g1_i1.p1 TRINITY_DN2649_c0_g1~~TRINITY_DN2649_c0_g1_i1.p1  ORF type:complete len:673 (-),score=211.86 TRINITY_DN2649_c0_g1_i1:18-2036(-)